MAENEPRSGLTGAFAGKGREIDLPGVSKELLNQLLYAGSQEQFQRLLAEHPELRRFAEVGFPMDEALRMLRTGMEPPDAADNRERVVLITEMRPGISYVVTETGNGHRTVNFFEFPADTLSALMLVTPEHLQLDIIRTLQVALHHPEYLTDESYWMLGEMLVSPRSSPELQRELQPLHAVLRICLEYGLNREWILTIRSEPDELD